jgi:hypothetical protein
MNSHTQDTEKVPKFDIQLLDQTPPSLEALEKDQVLHIEDVDQDYEPFSIDQFQTYNPIYPVLFGSGDYENQTLDHPETIHTLHSVIDTKTNAVFETTLFIKFSPLLDPIRYMIGKYDLTDKAIRTLPQPSASLLESVYPKLADPNNASYVDNFFCFLTSKLLKQHGFVHGLEYYGSFLGIQEKFKMNIADDFAYLNTSSFFLENKNKLFQVTTSETDEFYGAGSRANKNKLHISATNFADLGAVEIDTDSLDTEAMAGDLETVYENKAMQEKEDDTSSASTGSSNNSEMNYSDSESEAWETEDEESDADSGMDATGSSEAESIWAYLPKFPVQLICLEKCKGTADHLLETGSMKPDEIASFLMQVIMILITYQKAFHFTHNDLHTNNIMYNETQVQFLYYRFRKQVYRVPTYGRIYKIIDFGRAIYRYDGHIFCSDSFGPGGDAATQYNSEPYLDDRKPRLDPNFSFDLCRLGCSLFDFFADDDETPAEIRQTATRWCMDDNEKNVLYKRNGEERYPNFKLYKMIARTVHGHQPEEQLKFPLFDQFLMGAGSGIKDPIGSGIKDPIMDLDALPSYVHAK